MPKEDTVELRWILAVIRRWAWLLVGCAALAGIVAFFVTSRLPPKYAATATLLVAPAAEAGYNEYNLVVAGERLALTYGQMLRERPTLEAAIAELGLDETPTELAKRIKAEPIKDTQLVRLTVTDEVPQRAADIANTIAALFAGRVRALQGERYGESVAATQDKIRTLEVLISESEGAVSEASWRKAENEAAFAEISARLEEYRTDQREHQQTSRGLELVVQELTSAIRVAGVPWLPNAASGPPYTATVALIVEQPTVLLGGAYGRSLDSEVLSKTYGDLLTSPRVLEAAVAELNPDEAALETARGAALEPIAGTQLILLSVAEDDPTRALQIAETLAAALVNQAVATMTQPYAELLVRSNERLAEATERAGVQQGQATERTAEIAAADMELRRLETLLAEYRADYRSLTRDLDQVNLNAARAANVVVLSEQAHAPVKPTQNRLLYIVLAVVAGALAALGAAFLIEYMDDTLKTPEDIKRVLGLETPGTIGWLGNEPEPLVVLADPHSPAAEAFRMLAINTRLSATNGPLRTIMVTSTAPGEGKSVVAANLAAALARTSLRVIAVDADLRLPQLHELFGLSRENGLVEACEAGSPDASLQATTLEGLRVITSGRLPPDPIDLISSPRLASLLAGLTALADVVVIDSPPVLSVADSTILAGSADGVLMVVRAGQTLTGTARRAVEMLRNRRARVIGAVLNGVRRTEGNYYYRYGARRRKTASGRRFWSRPRGGLAPLPHEE